MIIRILLTVLALVLYTAPALAVYQVEIGGQLVDVPDPGRAVRNIYDFALLGAGLLGFLAVVYGAIRYSLAAGNPGGRTDARDQITQAFLGIIMLLGIFFILNVVNPNLTDFKLPDLEAVEKPSPADWGDGCINLTFAGNECPGGRSECPSDRPLCFKSCGGENSKCVKNYSDIFESGLMPESECGPGKPDCPADKPYCDTSRGLGLEQCRAVSGPSRTFCRPMNVPAGCPAGQVCAPAERSYNSGFCFDAGPIIGPSR